MQFVKAATLSEFHESSSKTITLLGKRVGIFKRDDGTFYAIEVTCKHHGADLMTGTRSGDVVTCPRHGWQYDIVTGECLKGNSPPLRRHALDIDGDEIRISLHPASSKDIAG